MPDAATRHALIMQRFHEIVAAQSHDERLDIPELCSAIGVADRTLRLCCQQQLGTSPKQFLLKRRMHLARLDLVGADGETTTVTEVATRYGFWEFGRFAGVYKSLFGELPSQTLASTGRIPGLTSPAGPPGCLGRP